MSRLGKDRTTRYRIGSLQWRFSGMFPRGKLAESHTRQEYTGDDPEPYRHYAGRNRLDQGILAAVHVALTETASPDYWLFHDETEKMEKHWFTYSRNLNL